MCTEQLDLSRLAKRLVSEDGLADEATALQTIEEYKKFFFMLTECEETSTILYLPSPTVDLVWQRHMLDTENYFTDCDRFDMPQGYCHRHELRSSTMAINLPNSEEKNDLSTNTDNADVQDNYSATLEAYESMYGCSPPEAVWPAVYDYGAQIEKRKFVNSRTDEKYLLYAIPHATIPPALIPQVDINDYALPDECVLIKNLLWVGEHVFDTLPLKQLKCVPGEVICQVAFEPQREIAVRKVVREYVRFLLLIMRQSKLKLVAAKEGREPEKSAEITPSKLVDELWHAHILCSPAYFQFCEQFAPLGLYLHHYPHFDKPHDYHVPGFNATLVLYKEVYEVDPVGGVWGVLGESGGGCGGGGCGGGGCGGGGCGGGGCGGHDGGGNDQACGGGGCSSYTSGCGGGRRRGPPPNYALVGRAVGCGAGKFAASCGAEGTDRADVRGFAKGQYPPRPLVDLRENARRKLLCEVYILILCLNMHNLPELPQTPLVVFSPYTTFYHKTYLLKKSVPKPVPFLTPEFVSLEIYQHWQTMVDRKMQVLYAAARAISMIPAGELKDKFWIEWKKSVHDTMDALLTEIGVLIEVPLMLSPRCCFSRERACATFYLEAVTPGRKWCQNSPTHPFVQLLPVPPPLPPNPPFVWNSTQINPVNLYTLQQKWVNADLAGAWKAPRILPPKAQPTVASKTNAPVCILSDVSNFATVDVAALEHVHKVVNTLPYVSTYMAPRTLFKSAEAKPIPFMRGDFVSDDLFAFIQHKIKVLAMERYAVAELVPTIVNPVGIGMVLRGVWTGATDTLMVDLAGQLTASYLAPIGLTLFYEAAPGYTRVFSIQSTGAKWLAEAYPSRMWVLPPAALCNSEYIVREMLVLMQVEAAATVAETAIAAAGVVASAPNLPSPYGGSSSPIVRAEIFPMGTYVPPSPAAVWAAPSPGATQLASTPPPEVLSVTIPVTYPQCGSEMMITSPSTGEQVKFFVPAGSQPGSQILLVLHRA